MRQTIQFFIASILLLAVLSQPEFIANSSNWCRDASTKIGYNLCAIYENHKSRLNIIILCSFGALLGPLFAPDGMSEKSSVPFLRLVFPFHSDIWYVRVDIMVTIIVGAALAYVIMRPSTPLHAIASGTGWSAILNKISKFRPTPHSKNHDIDNNKPVPSNGDDNNIPI